MSLENWTKNELNFGFPFLNLVFFEGEFFLFFRGEGRNPLVFFKNFGDIDQPEMAFTGFGGGQDFSAVGGE